MDGGVENVQLASSLGHHDGNCKELSNNGIESEVSTNNSFVFVALSPDSSDTGGSCQSEGGDNHELSEGFDATSSLRQTRSSLRQTRSSLRQKRSSLRQKRSSLRQKRAQRTTASRTRQNEGAEAESGYCGSATCTAAACSLRRNAARKHKPPVESERNNPSTRCTTMKKSGRSHTFCGESSLGSSMQSRESRESREDEFESLVKLMDEGLHSEVSSLDQDDFSGDLSDNVSQSNSLIPSSWSPTAESSFALDMDGTSGENGVADQGEVEDLVESRQTASGPSQVAEANISQPVQSAAMTVEELDQAYSVEISATDSEEMARRVAECSEQELQSRWDMLVLRDSRLQSADLLDREKRAILVLIEFLPPAGYTTLVRKRAYEPVLWGRELSVIDRINFLSHEHSIVSKAVMLGSTYLEDVNSAFSTLGLDAQPLNASGDESSNDNVNESDRSRLHLHWLKELDDQKQQVLQSMLGGSGSEDAKELRRICDSRRSGGKRGDSNAESRFRWHLRYLAFAQLGNADLTLDDAYTSFSKMKEFVTLGRAKGMSPESMRHAILSLVMGIKWRMSECDGRTLLGENCEDLTQKLKAIKRLTDSLLGSLKRESKEKAAAKPKPSRIMSRAAFKCFEDKAFSDLEAFATHRETPNSPTRLETFKAAFADEILQYRASHDGIPSSGAFKNSYLSKHLTELRSAVILYLVTSTAPPRSGWYETATVASLIGLQKVFRTRQRAREADNALRSDRGQPPLTSELMFPWDGGFDKQAGSFCHIDTKAFKVLMWWWEVRKLIFLYTFSPAPANFGAIDSDAFDRHVLRSASKAPMPKAFCSFSGGDSRVSRCLERISLYYSGFKLRENDLRHFLQNFAIGISESAKTLRLTSQIELLRARSNEIQPSSSVSRRNERSDARDNAEPMASAAHLENNHEVKADDIGLNRNDDDEDDYLFSNVREIEQVVDAQESCLNESQSQNCTDDEGLQLAAAANRDMQRRRSSSSNRSQNCQMHSPEVAHDGRHEHPPIVPNHTPARHRSPRGMGPTEPLSTTRFDRGRHGKRRSASSPNDRRSGEENTSQQCMENGTTQRESRAQRSLSYGTAHRNYGSGHMQNDASRIELDLIGCGDQPPARRHRSCLRDCEVTSHIARPCTITPHDSPSCGSKNNVRIYSQHDNGSRNGMRNRRHNQSQDDDRQRARERCSEDGWGSTDQRKSQAGHKQSPIDCECQEDATARGAFSEQTFSRQPCGRRLANYRSPDLGRLQSDASQGEQRGPSSTRGSQATSTSRPWSCGRSSEVTSHRGTPQTTASARQSRRNGEETPLASARRTSVSLESPSHADRSDVRSYSQRDDSRRDSRRQSSFNDRQRARERCSEGNGEYSTRRVSPTGYRQSSIDCERQVRGEFGEQTSSRPCRRRLATFRSPELGRLESVAQDEERGPRSTRGGQATSAPRPWSRGGRSGVTSGRGTPRTAISLDSTSHELQIDDRGNSVRSDRRHDGMRAQSGNDRRQLARNGYSIDGHHGRVPNTPRNASVDPCQLYSAVGMEETSRRHWSQRPMAWQGVGRSFCEEWMSHALGHSSDVGRRHYTTPEMEAAARFQNKFRLMQASMSMVLDDIWDGLYMNSNGSVARASGDLRRRAAARFDAHRMFRVAGDAGIEMDYGGQY